MALQLKLIRSKSTKYLKGKLLAFDKISGFTKNQSSIGNIIAHDIPEARKQSTFASNGNQIFNSGGYSSSSA
jgi:hypothetical protein